MWVTGPGGSPALAGLTALENEDGLAAAGLGGERPRRLLAGQAVGERQPLALQLVDAPRLPPPELAAGRRHPNRPGVGGRVEAVPQHPGVLPVSDRNLAAM